MPTRSLIPPSAVAIPAPKKEHELMLARPVLLCMFFVGCSGNTSNQDASPSSDSDVFASVDVLDVLDVLDVTVDDTVHIEMDSASGDGSVEPDVSMPDTVAIDTEGSDATTGDTGDDAGARCRPMPTGNPFYPQYPLPGTAAYPRRYQARGETLIDCVTGLEWQRNPPNVDLSIYAGETYCNDLVLGGYDDWVLPTRIQFVTLFDRSIPDPGPTIDTTAFPGALSGLYLTAVSPVLIDFQLSFSAGAVIVFNGDRSVSARVRCVRQLPAGNSTRFTDPGDGTIRDEVTGLLWQKATSAGRLRLADARTYCSTPSMNGLPGTGWRLPEILELESIVDDLSRGGPRLSPEFTPPNDPGLWSVGSSTVRGGTTAVYEVRYDGATYASGDGPFYVRCVR